jgi:ubiquinone/menaquinone biosynthesis C-methylase UbiE
MAQDSVAYGKTLNWSAVSLDYHRHRNGYPDSFFPLLAALGIGKAGQRILDLGTGTGNLSIPMARAGALLTGLDPAPGQIQVARDRARQEGLSMTLLEGQAEASGLPTASFEAVTASMCWGYFDTDRVVPEVLRLLAPGGLLALTSIVWQGGDDVAGRSNALIARYNPQFDRRQGQQAREEDTAPLWSQGRFALKTFHRYQEAVPFTHEQWRGRIRASKWIGAALAPPEVAAFDEEHRLLLENEPGTLQVQHRIRIQIFEALK